MKEIYYLNAKTLPTIPLPHDCPIKQICVMDRIIEFVFEEDISRYESIRFWNPQAKSLIMRYHLAYAEDDFSLYQWVGPRRPFQKDGRYKRLDNRMLEKLPEKEFRLEYLYHNVAYCSVITKLFSGGYVILDAQVDYIELEWIC